jgi:hypothetical protein
LFQHPAHSVMDLEPSSVTTSVMLNLFQHPAHSVMDLEPSSVTTSVMLNSFQHRRPRRDGS